MDWQKARDQFEEEMKKKLGRLPGHREVSAELFEFRGLISHELPETAPTEIFIAMIDILLLRKPVDLMTMRTKYLKPQLTIENEVLERNKNEFNQLRKSAVVWIKEKLPEEKLWRLWENHQTWLPRRYKIYKNENIAFEIIASDTLARWALIKKTK